MEEKSWGQKVGGNDSDCASVCKTGVGNERLEEKKENLEVQGKEWGPRKEVGGRTPWTTVEVRPLWTGSEIPLTRGQANYSKGW